jgi:hypothetical protein
VGGRIVWALLYYDHIIKGANGLTHTHINRSVCGGRLRRKVDGTMCVLGRLKGKKEKNLVENFVLEMDGAVNLRVDCI